MDSSAIRILLVEDNPADARLVNAALQQGGYNKASCIVSDEIQFRTAMEDAPDVVLCDWSLPQFDALTALEISKKMAPETPFIIVSGSIGEESAVLAIKQGASDYLLKDRLARLGQSIRHSIVQRNLKLAERRMREALRTSEAQYRLLADSIPQIVWMACPDGQLEYINQRAIEYTGLSRMQLTGIPIDQVIHPDDLRRFQNIRRTTQQNGIPSEIELRLRRFDGSYRWHIDRSVPVRDEHGTLVRWFGTSTDIHDQKLAAEKLARDAEILASVRDSVVVTTNDGTIVSWNAGAATLFGWSVNQAVGASFRRWLPETIDLPLLKAVENRESGAEWFGEYETVRADGKAIWVHSRVCPIRSSAPDSGLFLILSWDLTDRKRAEASLAAVMRSVDDTIMTIDRDGEIRSVNAAAARSTGFTESDLIGNDLEFLIPRHGEDSIPQFLMKLVDLDPEAASAFEREVQVRRKDGSVFPAELSVTDFILDGEPLFTCVLRDITARKRLEEQFHHAQRLEAVGRLAGGIAHDFNNLLTVINGHADFTLPRTTPGTDLRMSLEAIRDAGQRAAGLTSQLLAFSRKAIVAPRVVDLNHMILQSEKLLRRLIGEDILLATILCENPTLIQIDPNQLDQLIINLAVNARDAMPAGGRLIFETRHISREEVIRAELGLPATSHIELSIRDTGCGMPEGMFVRASLNRSSQPKVREKEPALVFPLSTV